MNTSINTLTTTVTAVNRKKTQIPIKIAKYYKQHTMHDNLETVLD